MHDFRRLVVWQRSRRLAVDVDHLARQFPRMDRGVLGAQLRRAAMSVPANIAEGCGKGTRRETLRYLQIASGSAAEIESHLVLATDLGYVNPRAYEALSGDTKAIQRMLYRLMANLP